MNKKDNKSSSVDKEINELMKGEDSKKTTESDNSKESSDESKDDATDNEEKSKDKKEEIDDIKPKSGGIMTKIHNFLSLDNRIEDTKEKIINRDPTTWHRILMAIVISCVGILIIIACLYDTLTENQVKEYTEKLYLGQASGEFKLPKGEYQILGMKPTKVDPQKPTERILQEGDELLVAAKSGGVIMFVPAPCELEIPKEFYDPDCYALTVGDDNKWEFTPTEHLNKMREEMKKREEMMEQYRKDSESKKNETMQPPKDNK